MEWSRCRGRCRTIWTWRMAANRSPAVSALHKALLPPTVAAACETVIFSTKRLFSAFALKKHLLFGIFQEKRLQDAMFFTNQGANRWDGETAAGRMAAYGRRPARRDCVRRGCRLPSDPRRALFARRWRARCTVCRSIPPRRV